MRRLTRRLGVAAWFMSACSVVTSMTATAAVPAPVDRDYPGVLRIAVDAHDVERRIVHIHETLTAPPEDLVLYFPKWIPGQHAPGGPIDRMAGLVIRAGERTLAWKRDPLDTHAFHVSVPAATDALDIRFDYLSPTSLKVAQPEMSRDVMFLEWIQMSLYPAGYYARRIPVEASLTLPAGFDFGSALQTVHRDGAQVQFAPTDLETFFDSPVYAGRYAKHIDLDPGSAVPVRLNVFADRPGVLDVPESELRIHRALVQQADRLFGARHYAHYDFLLSLSDQIQQIGTEHHQSSENGQDPEYFTDREATIVGRDLLAHEYTHSWNGKFRRPADLWTPSYDVPMQNSLLWVYEGQTQYWGQVLATRAGLWSHDEMLDQLATVAAFYDEQAGRSWRPLVDTTQDEVMNGRRPESWPSWQRFEEYYSEGQLIWLEADTLIRERSGGRKSLDDFARAFFGLHNGQVTPMTYTFEDVVHALNEVWPNDWAAFLHERVVAVAPKAPLEGLLRGGYRLVYDETENPFLKAADKHKHRLTLSSSVGLVIDADDGMLSDVSWNGPAFQAGLAEGMQIVACDGVAFDADRFVESLQAAKHTTLPMQWIVRQGDRYRVVDVDYHAGVRYPHLQREPKTVARLDDILKPRP
jgi:predicted metalloprotease with PDZ domain